MNRAASQPARVHLPRLVLARFFTRRLIKMAIIWGVFFGITIASTAITFAEAYPTAAARQHLAATFGGNAGLKVLLGEPVQLDTIAGFTAWRSLGIVLLVGSIWGLLAATKVFRGEEETGRLELLLVGQTTARQAAANMFAALGVCLSVMYVLSAVMTIAVGQFQDVDFTVGGSLFLAAAVILPAAEMLAVGAVMSQLMPTRSRAAAWTAGFFGLFFVLRGIGLVGPDVHWLVYVSPLGWIGQLHPLTGSQPLWLVPIGTFVLVLGALAVWLAGKRDLGASIFSDKDHARPRLALLVSPLGLSFRLIRGLYAGWLMAIACMGFVFGSLAKTAGDAFSASSGLEQALGKITSEARLSGATSFLGLIFFMIMTLLMIFAASSVIALREEEAQSRLDNLLVRPVARLRWLGGRILLLVLSIGVAGFLASCGAWLGSASQHSGIAFDKVLLAGINATVPALTVAGIGILTVGFLPRLTSVVTYGVIAWSFLVQMVGPVGNANHWILDTSILHHLALVPAVEPRWGTLAVLVGCGVVAAALGAWRFRYRDLETV